MFCTQCGQQNIDIAKFCNNCGNLNKLVSNNPTIEDVTAEEYVKIFFSDKITSENCKSKSTVFGNDIFGVADAPLNVKASAYVFKKYIFFELLSYLWGLSQMTDEGIISIVLIIMFISAMFNLLIFHGLFVGRRLWVITFCVFFLIIGILGELSSIFTGFNSWKAVLAELTGIVSLVYLYRLVIIIRSPEYKEQLS